MTPKPRNAKKVSATLAAMSPAGGYSDGASSAKSAVASVVTANRERMPITITTTTDCTRATACEPNALSAVMATMRRAANALVAHTGSSAPTAELA